ncbi:hypothetical protein HanRHA438_Chr10g0470941 [Helianthus annuus]|nr:hypothetical protein HanHA300_Chr10g0376391 [Helianthus annuus]KAJ0523406.1 hypothetical protein HanIR_Chr10g0493521 [Helianthus annuus]KAJ0531218.1 hypothetical protein HanHA89_Chr10g0398741 [Helianthus annuus]KAJ0698069.1 hypothetical protein HanLR1_Chr10g0376061 [Helianthus annuus]KAJ0701438.1 hypothetical protein HanOQP8_Chr10g0379381 [Helianthus annuus]
MAESDLDEYEDYEDDVGEYEDEGGEYEEEEVEVEVVVKGAGGGEGWL